MQMACHVMHTNRRSKMPPPHDTGLAPRRPFEPNPPTLPFPHPQGDVFVIAEYHSLKTAIFREKLAKNPGNSTIRRDANRL